MRARQAVPALLLLLAVLPSPAAAAGDGEPVELESEHYRLRAWPPFPEGEEYLRLAEALYGRLREHFGAEPAGEGKLAIRMWPDAEGYRKGAEAEGVPESLLGAGGVYFTGNRRAYFWRQPSANFTRHLFLHELTHQFHYLAVMDNRARCPSWYAEGLAEEFGYHDWDGERLVTGLDDVVGLEQDVPAMAEEARSGAFDVVAVVGGARGGDKPPSWAAVHWFLHSPDPRVRSRFRAAEKRMWRGLAGKPLVDALLGHDRGKAREAAREYLGSLRTSWRIEWITWESRGGALVGESATVALIRARDGGEGAAAVEATLAPGEGSAGLVLAFRSLSDFLAVYRRPGGAIQLVRRTPSGWEVLASGAGPPEAPLPLRASLDERGRVAVRTGERLLLEHAVEGARAGDGTVGLFVDGGRARFSEVRVGGDR